MSVPREISERAEAIILVAGVASWVVLWQLPHYVWLAIPPYRDRPGASVGIQVVAYGWAAFLLLLPFILPVIGCHLSVRQWMRGGRSRLSAMAWLALALFPIGVVGVGILARMTDTANLDSAATPLFYWWPH
jgi:hypothetical protein